jgi:hypothetical protein
MSFVYLFIVVGFHDLVQLHLMSVFLSISGNMIFRGNTILVVNAILYNIFTSLIVKRIIKYLSNISNISNNAC